MKNLILLTAILALFTTSIFAQNFDQGIKAPAFHKNITIEFGGSHILWGLNYDMRFQKGRNDGFGFKVGVGGVNSNIENNTEGASLGFSLISIPLEINHVLGKRKHGLITGLGLLTGYASFRGESPDYRFNLQGVGVAAAYATVGYRLQPLENGFTFQINVNPFFELHTGTILPYAGISIGYGFK